VKDANGLGTGEYYIKNAPTPSSSSPTSGPSYLGSDGQWHSFGGPYTTTNPNSPSTLDLSQTTINQTSPTSATVQVASDGTATPNSLTNQYAYDYACPQFGGCTGSFPEAPGNPAGTATTPSWLQSGQQQVVSSDPFNPNSTSNAAVPYTDVQGWSIPDGATKSQDVVPNQNNGDAMIVDKFADDSGQFSPPVATAPDPVTDNGGVDISGDCSACD
jgi:hypothetical protein